MPMNNKVKSLYENSEYQNIIHDISDVYFPLSPNWKNIGISLSGGCDSALMAYIICDLIKRKNYYTKIHIIYNVRLWKTRPWQQHIFKQVFAWFKETFKDIKFIEHTNFIAPDLEWGSKGPNIIDEYGKLKSGNQIELRSHAEYIGHNYNLDAWFCGLTKNPEIKFDGRLTDRDSTLSNDTVENLHRLIKPHMNGVACHPFTFVQKDWIVSQYKRLGIMNLFNLTRSCEGDKETYPEIFGNLDYKTYVPGKDIPVCGKCFWCKERQWGIDNSD
jgi:hypothetical protein